MSWTSLLWKAFVLGIGLFITFFISGFIGGLFIGFLPLGFLGGFEVYVYWGIQIIIMGLVALGILKYFT